MGSQAWITPSRNGGGRLVPGDLGCLEVFSLLFLKIVFAITQCLSNALNILFAKWSLKGVIRKMYPIFTFI